MNQNDSGAVVQSPDAADMAAIGADATMGTVVRAALGDPTPRQLGPNS